MDYVNCRSTFFTTACDLPYDYASIMHYGATEYLFLFQFLLSITILIEINSFAIDSSKNVMTALDTSVTSFGNTVMSEMDKKKLQCLYQCDGTAYSK